MGGDLFRERFDKIEMARRDNGFDVVHYVFVADDIGQRVAVGGFMHGQVDIDADRLGAAMLVGIDADVGFQHQVAHKDMADGAGGVGDLHGRDGFGFCHHQVSRQKEHMGSGPLNVIGASASHQVSAKPDADRRRVRSSGRSWQVRQE